MKKLLILILAAGMFGVLGSGCGKRLHVTTIEKERVDQNVGGNKGYFGGKHLPAADTTPQTRSSKREVIQVSVDLPQLVNPTEDKELTGNRGYIQGGPNAVSRSTGKENGARKINLPEESQEPVRTSQPQTVIAPVRTQPQQRVIAPVVEETVSEPAYSVYVVEKGDTLQKISEKQYGTIKKWKKIFDFNSNTLKNPNKIYPGQKLKIPQQ